MSGIIDILNSQAVRNASLSGNPTPLMRSTLLTALACKGRLV